MTKTILTLTTLAVLCCATPALAHTPLFSCYANGDGTVTCEGGFSDGSSAAGVAIIVSDGAGTVLQKTKLDKFSEVTFDKPQGEYTVRFDAGEGHQIDVKGADIVD